MSEEIILDAEERMENSIAHLKENLNGIRTGRANPGLVDSLTVTVASYGGADSPLKSLASVSVPEPSQILIRPFDPGTLKDIEKAIINSNLGYAPNNDGRVIRLNIPALSTEVRKSMCSRIKEFCESCKIAMRNVRRDANKALDQMEKDKSVSEDERDSAKEDIQKSLKKLEEKADELAKAREKDVME